MSFVNFNKMATGVRFCSSYGPFKLDFVTFKMNTVDILLTLTLSMTLCLCAKVLLHVWSYNFDDTTLSIE